MEKYTKILQQITKEKEAIRKEDARINALNYEAEKSEALENFDKTKDRSYLDKYKAYRESAENNAGEVSKLHKSIYIRNIKIRILQANARASLFADGWKVISEAFKPYNGKQYGEKTRDKVYKEVKAAGYYFYFKGSYEKHQIEISPVPENPNHYRMIEAVGGAADIEGKYSLFISKENTINVGNVQAHCYDNYVEDVNGRAREIYKAIHAYQDALKKAKAAGSALNSILPSGIEHPDYLKDYTPTFPSLKYM